MRTQTNKIRNERGTITTNPPEIPKKKKIIRKYYKHLYTNRLPRRNGQISRNIQTAKTKSRRNKQFEYTDY